MFFDKGVISYLCSWVDLFRSWKSALYRDLHHGCAGFVTLELSIRTDLHRKRELAKILKKFFGTWQAETIDGFYVVTVDAEPQRLKHLLFALEHGKGKHP